MTIGGDGPGSQVRKLICGVFLAFVIISPLRQVDLDGIWTLPEQFYEEGQNISAAAREDVNMEISAVIIDRTRTYILDEAESLGAQLQVTRIALDPDTLAPNGVELTGSISPYARSALSGYIENTLGIEKEAQVWKQ